MRSLPPNLGHRVAASTTAKTLKEHAVKPAPDRLSSWRVFLKAHWEEIAATDFFTSEVWTPIGLRHEAGRNRRGR